MSTLTISPTDVRRAWSAIDELPGIARRVGRALVECLDWGSWSSPEPVDCLDPARGISRRRLAELADCSPRSVSRALADLQLSGLVQVQRRTWLESWYRLDAGELVRLWRERGEASRRARVRRLLGRSSGAESLQGPVSASGASDEGTRSLAPARPLSAALARARERLGPAWPSWASRHPTPRDIAALAMVWAEVLDPRPELAAGLYAPRIAALWRSTDLDVDAMAEALAAVAAVIREGVQARPGRYVSAWDALRPRRWAALVAGALERVQAAPEASAELVGRVADELAPGPVQVWEIEDLVIRAASLRRLRGPQLDALRAVLLGRVAAEASDESDEEPATLAEAPELRVDHVLAALSLHIDDVEQLVGRVDALPALPELGQRSAVDPERRAVHGRRLLRAELRREAEAWLGRARALLDAPQSASVAALDDLSAALARLRELGARLS